MRALEPKRRSGRPSHISDLQLNLERFRAEVLYKVLRKKGYAVSIKAASAHAHEDKLENAAKKLRQILPPPVTSESQKRRSRLFWPLLIVGIIIFFGITGAALYISNPEMVKPIFFFIVEFF